MTTLTKLCLGASLIVGLGAMLFLGYQAGMGIVQDWEDFAGSDPEPQASVGDLAWIGGLLFAALLALAVRFRPRARGENGGERGGAKGAPSPQPLQAARTKRRHGRRVLNV
jgi:hypothetical protein